MDWDFSKTCGHVFTLFQLTLQRPGCLCPKPSLPITRRISCVPPTFVQAFDSLEASNPQDIGASRTLITIGEFQEPSLAEAILHHCLVGIL